MSCFQTWTVFEGLSLWILLLSCYVGNSGFYCAWTAYFPYIGVHFVADWALVAYFLSHSELWSKFTFTRCFYFLGPRLLDPVQNVSDVPEVDVQTAAVGWNHESAGRAGDGVPTEPGLHGKTNQHVHLGWSSSAEMSFVSYSFISNLLSGLIKAKVTPCCWWWPCHARRIPLTLTVG